MKTVILAGGRGTRISEESGLKPKPMIEIGGMPILWHIMKHYSSFGHNDFIICCGYKGYMIKEYFANYYLHRSDITFDFTSENKMHVHCNVAEPWKVTLVDTGIETMTGGRIKRVEKYIKGERFMLTYGDGLSDVDLNKMLKFHEESGKTVTLTTVRPAARFGYVEPENGGKNAKFVEKGIQQAGWINGGFMAAEPEIFKYLKDDTTVFEKNVLEKLGAENKLAAFRHEGFWQSMDTLRDKILLDGLIERGKAPWVKW
ncbi:MAG TPA: glucose-1-phosphate cytidylyltransferase [Candidatus Goldiibacteriota bacterium]|nr:glucose-1-phosphate cytidylyltransferase [Candidatus Goldiibacteriota bacterium]